MIEQFHFLIFLNPSILIDYYIDCFIHSFRSLLFTYLYTNQFITWCVRIHSFIFLNHLYNNLLFYRFIYLLTFPLNHQFNKEFIYPSFNSSNIGLAPSSLSWFFHISYAFFSLHLNLLEIFNFANNFFLSSFSRFEIYYAKTILSERSKYHPCLLINTTIYTSEKFVSSMWSFNKISTRISINYSYRYVYFLRTNVFNFPCIYSFTQNDIYHSFYSVNK